MVESIRITAQVDLRKSKTLSPKSQSKRAGGTAEVENTCLASARP
jgi:hypothetical protein